MLRDRFPEQRALKDQTVAVPALDVTCALKVRKQKEGRRLRHESRDSPSFPTMYGGREALPDGHKFRGQRGRVRARYRRPQLGRGTEKIGETSQRKTNLQLASGGIFL